MKILKWIGILLAVLIGFVVAAIAAVSMSTKVRLNRTYEIQIEAVVIPTDAASVAEGERIAAVYCGDCHAEDLGGKRFFDDPALAVVDSTNLTGGQGGVGSTYTDADWVRAIRHGADPQGKPLFIMPAKDFYYFSEEDLGQLIAYLKTLPPIDRPSTPLKTGVMGKILLAAGAFGDVFNVETIDHAAPRPISPEPGVTAEYGEYLALTFGCQTCHGEELAGGKDPNPDAPPGPNLTRGGIMADWDQADFIAVVRTRKSEWMPFETLAKMSDEELAALFGYLQSLPALETAVK